MGVPKFYRWISERYPKINQIVSDTALLPEFDHLYLDMNGIIHGCTHPSHMDVSDVLTEREMMLGIMQYLDRIITQIVKPKVSVYMAIDGVAPRAKLNQQRSRRFRSAKDLTEATKDLPKDAEGNVRDRSTVFDSNCITPGTEFLAKVSTVIQYFIRKKIKDDPFWHTITVIFSGHDIPGEGEHKIMQHIREMKNQPGYKCNTRHCIYGQDADLIMLGLVTHEPHFTILREVIDFNFSFDSKNTLKAVKKFVKESDFQLLHLSILREYLQFEFECNNYNNSNNNETTKFYNLERVIDDFVFMTFLVGNDFLPHMPTLDIGDGAFDLLFDIYKRLRLTWPDGEYLTESGNISDPHRLEEFLAAIGDVETDILEQKEKDNDVYIAKRRKWDRRDGKEEGPTDAQLKAIESQKQSSFITMMESLLAKHNIESDDFVLGWKPVPAGEKDFKGRYYYEKMSLTPVQKDEHWHLRRSYMEGLMWCLAYYYRGCISWGWFYPYHYGPMLSDLTDIPRMFEEIRFELGEPLTPFQQLMGCLPPASSALVPKLYRWLMSSKQSPIIEFYPEDFAVDMNGKKNPWEGVNLLPFININLLKETIALHCPDTLLTAAERIRNRIGKVYGYRYDPTCQDVVPSPDAKLGFPEFSGSHSSVTIIDDIPISSSVTFKPELQPGSQIPYPGFPSLNVVPIANIELRRIGLNCFGTPSKYYTMLLTLHEMPALPAIETFATNVLNKSLFINWPLMHEGKAVAISDGVHEIRLAKNGTHVTKKLTQRESERWISDSHVMFDMYNVGNGVPGAGGVNIGEIKIRLKLLPLQGMKTNANGSTKKIFGNEEADVPLQLALWQAPAPDPRFQERGPRTLEDRFPSGCGVILTKGKYRGCKGIVVGVVDKKSVGVKVQTLPPEIPFGLAIAKAVQETFVSSIDASRILKMHPGLFGKVTGRLQFDNKYDLGLNLKTADGTCVVGYTRKKVEHAAKRSGSDDKTSAWAAGDAVLVIGSKRNAEDDDREEKIQWEFTPKAIRLVDEFRNKFPQLFAAINKNPNERKYEANAVFGPNGKAWLPVVREWLDNHPTAKLPRTPVTTEVMSYEATAAVQRAADARTLALSKRGYPKESLIKIPGTALYREASTGPTDVILASDFNDNRSPELGDRIVNLCGYGIPFGARGTVVGIHEAATTGSVEVVMDEEFMGGSNLQGACSNFRGKLCLWAHLLRITPDNSKVYLDKLIPKGSKQSAPHVAVNKIISSIDRQGKGDNTDDHSETNGINAADVEPAKPPAVDEKRNKVRRNASKEYVLPVNSGNKQGTDTTKKSIVAAGSASRNESTGRSRQGAWREARGPDEQGIGFKGMRKGGVTGLTKWKNIVTNQEQEKSSSTTDVDVVANSLKNVSITNSTIAVDGVAGNGVSHTAAAAVELKALLGLKSTTTDSSIEKISAVQAPAPTASSAAEGLKALLGVGSSGADVAGGGLTSQPNPQQQPQAQLQPQPEPPSTAADKLLQLLSKQVPRGPPEGIPFQPVQMPRSAFNFTYVDEGKEPPPPPLVHPIPMAPTHHGFFGAMPPVPMPQHPPAPMHHPYGIPIHPHYGFQPPSGGPQQPFPIPPPPPMDEFPPLG